jgi:ATP-dependent RNA helicase DeaD
VTEEDRKVASLLLADKPAEALVAALVRQRRDARPSPEELTRVMGPAVKPPLKPAKPPRNERRIANVGNPNGPDRRRVNKGGDLQKVVRPPREDFPRDERPARAPSSPAAERSERPARAPAGAAAERQTRGAPAAPNVTGGGRWFTVNVGRSKNADPKWLIPLLCRRGNVTKKAIGKIQVLMRETRVEIAPDVAEQFAEAIRRPDDKDKNIHIEPVDE